MEKLAPIRMAANAIFLKQALIIQALHRHYLVVASLRKKFKIASGLFCSCDRVPFCQAVQASDPAERSHLRARIRRCGYSMTSSARPRSGMGRLRPRALAVLRLTMNSILLC